MVARYRMGVSQKFRKKIKDYLDGINAIDVITDMEPVSFASTLEMVVRPMGELSSRFSKLSWRWSQVYWRKILAYSHKDK